jgi:hypothetical protein
VRCCLRLQFKTGRGRQIIGHSYSRPSIEIMTMDEYLELYIIMTFASVFNYFILNLSMWCNFIVIK